MDETSASEVRAAMRTAANEYLDTAMEGGGKEEALHILASGFRTLDAGDDSRMPAEIDGKRVVSAFRRPPVYSSLAYTYIVIVDEAGQDVISGMNMYTVGIAVCYHPGAVADGSAWMLTETRAGMTWPAAGREFAQLAYHAANAGERTS